MVIPMNNEQTNLKINLTRCYFSMLENIFNIIWLIFEGFKLSIFSHSLHACQILANFKKFNFHVKISRFPNGLTYGN